jgi:hypothetical protein
MCRGMACEEMLVLQDDGKRYCARCDAKERGQ